MTIGGVFHYHSTPASINRFNTSRFHSWRAGFREVFKLRTKLEQNLDDQQQKDISEWISVWLTVGSEEPYGEDAIMGANDALGWDPIRPQKVNKFSYLKDMWTMKYGD